MKNTEITATKRGFVAAWENGGGLTSGGSATVIAKPDGSQPRAVYVPRGGHLACGNHALICIHEGYYLVHVGVHRGERSSGRIERVVSTSVRDIDGHDWKATAEVEVINTFDHGEWDLPLGHLEAAVEAAFNKASIYHCRRAFYVDTSDKPELTAEQKKERDAEMRRRDAERQKLRDAKARRDAEAAAEKQRQQEAAEVASRDAKTAGFGTRMEAVNDRLQAIGASGYELGDTYFSRGWGKSLYTEENVSRAESSATDSEADFAEKQRQQELQAEYRPQFEAYAGRLAEQGWELDFSDEKVRARKAGSRCGFELFAYADEGLNSFVAHLEELEAKAAAERRQAQLQAEYAVKRAAAAELGLPQDITIWCRRGSMTNAGDGWVIGPDGQDREPTSMYNSNPRRLQRYGEGDKIWEQILSGEVVLEWGKSFTAAPHEFKVAYLPEEGLTEAQLERIAEIQDELEAEWKGARGMSGKTSPPIGDGWGLLPQNAPAQEKSTRVAVLDENGVSGLFGGNVRIK